MARSTLNLPGAVPAARPLQGLTEIELRRRFASALASGDGLAGAHCVHEGWLRGDTPLHVERALETLWHRAGATVPDWLPMRYIERLPDIYEIALRFHASGQERSTKGRSSKESSAKGRSNIYLVLLDYSDSRPEPHGIYVGMTKYTPAQRFDQHKAGIRAAGSVLRRGLEVLTGPTQHLQGIKRADAARIEGDLAEALTAAGFFVQGGH
jgi:hypothetical protein